MVMPYQDQTNSIEARVDDLVGRLTLADKAGLMFHDIVAMGPGGSLMPGDNSFGRPDTQRAITEMRLNHFNLAGGVDNVADLIAWHNRMQELAARHGTWHPGHPFHRSPPLTSATTPAQRPCAGAFSQWPESLGLAALGDADLVDRFADIARQEYLAVGIRVALHPQIDLATEPRWARIADDVRRGRRPDVPPGRRLHPRLPGRPAELQVGGHHDQALSRRRAAERRRGPALRVRPRTGLSRRPTSTTTCKPFRAAIAAGTSQMMPYYGMPVGTDYEEVGFAFNRGVITDLLRGELGFDGIVCTDWGLISDSAISGQSMPARAWGVEHLSERSGWSRSSTPAATSSAGRPALNSSSTVDRGRISEARLDVSVRAAAAREVRPRPVRPALPRRGRRGQPPSAGPTSSPRARPPSARRSYASPLPTLGLQRCRWQRARPSTSRTSPPNPRPDSAESSMIRLTLTWPWCGSMHPSSRGRAGSKRSSTPGHWSSPLTSGNDYSRCARPDSDHRRALPRPAGHRAGDRRRRSGPVGRIRCPR